MHSRDLTCPSRSRLKISPPGDRDSAGATVAPAGLGGVARAQNSELRAHMLGQFLPPRACDPGMPGCDAALPEPVDVLAAGALL
jgi:hypothetical protein